MGKTKKQWKKCYKKVNKAKKKLEKEKKEWMRNLEKMNPDLDARLKESEDGFKLPNLSKPVNQKEEKEFIAEVEDTMKWYDALLEDKISSLQYGLTLPKVKSYYEIKEENEREIEESDEEKRTQYIKDIVKAYEKGRVIVDTNLKLGESFDINKVFATLEKKNRAFFKCDNSSDMKKFLFPMNYWAIRFSGML